MEDENVCKGIRFFFLRNYFFKNTMKWRDTHRDKNRRKKLFHLLVHSPNPCSSKDWARLKPRSCSSVQASCVWRRDAMTWLRTTASYAAQKEDTAYKHPRTSLNHCTKQPISPDSNSKLRRIQKNIIFTETVLINPLKIESLFFQEKNIKPDVQYDLNTCIGC